MKTHIIDYETPLLEAINDIIKHEFALVKQFNKIKDIITIADVSQDFYKLSEPFLLLEQIENNLRVLLDGKYLLEEIKSKCKEEDRDISYIDDLSFGEYIRLIENEGNWEKLQIPIDRVCFINKLHEVRLIRNDVMHFDPDGITHEQHQILKKMSVFLQKFI